MRRIRIYDTSEQALYRPPRRARALRGMAPRRGPRVGAAPAGTLPPHGEHAVRLHQRQRGGGARPRPLALARSTGPRPPRSPPPSTPSHYPHLLRIWNYLPDINHASHGNGRYRQFNSARQHALRASGRARQPVAGVFPGRAHGAGVRGEPAAAERQSLPAAARRAQPRCFRGPRWCAGRGASRCSSPAPVLAGVERARLPSSARRIPG